MKHRAQRSPVHRFVPRHTSQLARVTGVALASILGAALLTACGDEGESAEAHLQKAVEYRDQGNQRAAVIELKNALQQDPEHARARWMLGDSYLQLGDGASADKELRRARDLGFQGAGLDLALAKAALLQGRFEEVLDDFERKAGADWDPAWLVLRGEAHLGLGQMDEAKSDFESALRGDPNNVEARRGVARIDMASGDTASAEKQIERVLESSGEDIQTWLLKGELELSLRRFDDAQRSFEKALELAPTNAAAHIGAARALLAQAKPDEAAVYVDRLAEGSPNNPLVFYLKALVARQKQDNTAAEEALREVLRVAPDHAPSLLLMGQINYEQREFEQAEQSLRRYVSRAPNDAQARKLLAAIYLELKQPDKAIQTLKPLESRSPNDPQLLAMLGTAYMGKREFDTGRAYLDRAASLAPKAAPIRTQLALSHLATGDATEAVTELEAAVEQDPDFARADFLLVLTHLQKREYDKATEAAIRLTEKQPDNSAAQNLLGATYEASGDLDNARKHYAKSVELNPDYVSGALNLARLDLRTGNVDAARKAYDAVLEKHPDQPIALVALAKIASDAGRPQEGVALLERARSKNPTALQPRLILANYYLRQGNRAEALAIAEEAHSVAAGNTAVRLMLGRAQLANGRTDAALDTLKALADELPKSAGVHYQLALAYGQKGDAERTRESLEKVLQIDPEHLVAKVALANLALRTGDAAQAETIAADLRKTRPDGPEGYVLQGDVALTKNQLDKAAAAYRTALGKRESTSTMLKLYGAQRRAGDNAAADKTLREWVDKYPLDTTARVTLASAMHQSGDKAAAIREYEKVLEQQPGNVIALNNLAWLYHEKGDARGMKLAEQAYRAVPGRPEIADTYGWLLVESGKVEQGLSILEAATKNAPNNGDIRYHYAAGLAKAGDKRRAKKELASLLAGDDQFSERAAAQALYESLH